MTFSSNIFLSFSDSGLYKDYDTWPSLSVRKTQVKEKKAEVVSAERQHWHAKERVNNWNSLWRKSAVLMVGLSACSGVGTWCQANLQAVEGSLFNEMVITSSPKACLQTLCEKDSLEESVFVPGALLNYTGLCHCDVPVIKGCATPAPQPVTVSYSWKGRSLAHICLCFSTVFAADCILVVNTVTGLSDDSKESTITIVQYGNCYCAFHCF